MKEMIAEDLICVELRRILSHIQPTFAFSSEPALSTLEFEIPSIYADRVDQLVVQIPGQNSPQLNTYLTLVMADTKDIKFKMR